MIIAECGQAHMGSMSRARTLINFASSAGADLVKFQLYDHQSLYGDKLPDVALSFVQAQQVFEFGKTVDIEVFFSVFDVERVKWCEEIGVKRYKIACKMRDTAVMEAVAATNKPAIMSMNDDYGAGHLCGGTEAYVDYLYCVPEYPAPVSGILYGVDFDGAYEGFSDHAVGLDVAKIAMAEGAQIIEKHFALSHNVETDGPDAPWSMVPDELKELKRWEEVVQTCQ